MNPHEYSGFKVLVFDKSGVWVLAKRLDQGTFDWPRGTETEATVTYRAEELALLLGGFDAPVLAARKWKRRKPETKD